MSQTPPFEACVRCHRGDTPTAHGFVGEAGFIEGGLFTYFGLKDGADASTFAYALSDQLDRRPDDLAEGERVGLVFRVCEQCGEATGVEIAEAKPGQKVPVTFQDGPGIRFDHPN